MSAFTIGLAEAKNNFSKITAEVNRTGKPVTVLKNNRPWVVIAPAVSPGDWDDIAIDILTSSEYALVDLGEAEL